MPEAKGRILVLNGPNLNLLGTREPAIYGSATLAQLMERAGAAAQRLGYAIDTKQSNDLGTMIDAVHAAASVHVGIVLNAGAFTHYAWGLHDALKSVNLPVVEVHLSNPAARDPWRHESVIASAVVGTIAGFGAESYVLGVEALVRHVESR